MTMNAVALYIGYSTCTIRHLRQHFKRQSVRKTDYVVDVRALRCVAKTAIFGTPNCAIASKLPQLLLLTPMVHITNVYLPKLCLGEGGLSARHPYVCSVLARRHRVNCVNWARKYQRSHRQQWNSVLFSDDSRFTFIEVMAGFKYTVGEMNVMPTVAYMNEIVSGVGFCLRLGGHCTRLSH